MIIAQIENLIRYVTNAKGKAMFEGFTLNWGSAPNRFN
jgi:hypothetical protein